MQDQQNLTDRIKDFLKEKDKKKQRKVTIGAVVPMQRELPALVNKQKTVFGLITPILQLNENISVEILEEAVVAMIKNIEAAYLFTAEGVIPSCELCDNVSCSICPLINSIIRNEIA